MIVRDKDGNEVPPGSTIISFRGEQHTFIGVESLPSPGKSGKLKTDRGTFYPHVFGLTIVEVEK